LKIRKNYDEENESINRRKIVVFRFMKELVDSCGTPYIW